MTDGNRPFPATFAAGTFRLLCPWRSGVPTDSRAAQPAEHADETYRAYV